MILLAFGLGRMVEEILVFVEISYRACFNLYLT